MAEVFGVSLDDLVNYDSNEYGLVVPPKGKHMFEGRIKGRHAVANEKLLENIRAEVQQHLAWYDKLESMVKDMKILPIQTNDKKSVEPVVEIIRNNRLDFV